MTELNDMKLDSDKEESAIDQHMTAIVRDKEEAKKAKEKRAAYNDLVD